MSRRSLREIQAGRDPQVFGKNLREWRMEVGWSLARLARESNVSYPTLLNIERGKGCTPLIERKLSDALRVGDGALWKHRERRYSVLHTPSRDRWHFMDREQCASYMRRLGRHAEGEPFRFDPDEIQEEQERFRLGRVGLSIGFTRVTSATLVSGTIASYVQELFGRATMGDETIEGTFFHLYCLRGCVQVANGEDVFVIKERDTVSFERRPPTFFEPVQSWSKKDLPPQLVQVEVDPYRLKPLTGR